MHDCGKDKNEHNHHSAEEQLQEIYEKFSHSVKPVHKAYVESIHALVNLMETRDPYTKRHSVKVSNLAVMLAKKIGLSKTETGHIKLAGILHDIGKIGIPEKVLLKNSSLNKEEYDEVKKHSAIGAEIIKPLKFFAEIIIMVRHHHENYDGTGYPDGLKGEDIPMGSRIMAVADAFDALTNTRAYRGAYDFEKAIEIMKKENGKKFDPALFSAFMDCISEVKKEGRLPQARGKKEAKRKQ